MASRLKRFWGNPKLWPICFSILFGYDAANITMDQGVDPNSLLTLFSKRKVAYPESLVIITAMLQHGLKDTMKRQDNPGSPVQCNEEVDISNRISDLSVDTSCKCTSWPHCFPSRSNFSNLCEKKKKSLTDRERAFGGARRRFTSRCSLFAGPTGAIARFSRLCPQVGVDSNATCCSLSLRREHRRSNPRS